MCGETIKKFIWLWLLVERHWSDARFSSYSVLELKYQHHLQVKRGEATTLPHWRRPPQDFEEKGEG